MHFVTRSFLGHTDDQSWSQYWENEPDDPSLVLHRGHLFALINLHLGDGLASDIGHLFISEINQTYFSSIEVPSPIWLKRTLETVSQSPVFKDVKISLMVAVVLDGYLHLCFLNQGLGIFHRGTKISQILSGVQDQIQQISGKLTSSDQFLLCTPEFLNNYTWDKIKSYLSGNTIQDIEESFLFDLNSFPDQSSLAGLLVQTHQEESPVTSLDESPPIPTPASKPKSSFFQKIFSSRPTYVSHLSTDKEIRRKKINIFLSVLVLLALFVSIYFGARQNKVQQTETKYQSLKSQYTTKINNALAIKNISLDESQQEARDSKEIIQKMTLLKVHSDEIDKFNQEVNSLLSQTGSAEAYKPTSFYDTTLIGDNSHYSKISLSHSKLYLLDSGSGRVDSLDINNRSLKKILPSDVARDLESLALDAETLYVLKDKVVSSITGQSLIPKIDLGKEITDFQSGALQFWNGSLYVLVKLTDGSSTIWKFAPNSTGFSPGSSWIKDPKTLPVSATSFAINGQIWVLGTNGQIVPFTHGIPDPYKSNNKLSSATNLVTSVDSEILAFTEKDNLVYIYHKTDSSAASYNFDKRKILSLALDGPSKTVFVLCDDQKIYKISL